MIKLAALNNWWLDKEVKASVLKPYKRKLFYEILKYLKDRRILVILGLRRVGKTTVLYQIIQHLLENGENSKNILYFSFDEKVENLGAILETYSREILGKTLDEVNPYIFLDEIQKLENWEEQLKLYYDTYPNLKFIVSGSASLNIQQKARESLAGRCYYFHLDVLYFEEFLEMRHGLKIPEEPELWIDRLDVYMFDYIKRAFPEVILEENEEKAKRYIREAVIERIIFRDLPSEFGIKDIDILETLTKLIIENPGLIINVDGLSKSLKRNKRTISNYLNYLEYALILTRVKNYRRSELSASRKMKKAYPSHPALIFGVSEKYYDLTPKLIENLILNFLQARHYWREKKHEVDFVIKNRGKLVGVEVKYSREISRKDLDGLIKFMAEFNTEGIVVTKDTMKEETINGKKVRFIPASIFLLMPQLKSQ